MKAFYFPEQQNIEILKELRYEYITTDYLCFVNEINFYLGSKTHEVQHLAEQVFYVIDKIIIDNIFKYVAHKQIEMFVFHITNALFSKDLYINNFYISQILQAANVIESEMTKIEYDLTDIENGLRLILSNYIDRFLSNNFERYQIPIMSMFEVMNSNFSHLNILHYKFELMNNIRPMLLYSEMSELLNNEQQVSYC